jgi:hypothetical protein
MTATERPENNPSIVLQMHRGPVFGDRPLTAPWPLTHTCANQTSFTTLHSGAIAHEDVIIRMVMPFELHDAAGAMYSRHAGCPTAQRRRMTDTADINLRIGLAPSPLALADIFPCRRTACEERVCAMIGSMVDGASDASNDGGGKGNDKGTINPTGRHGCR